MSAKKKSKKAHKKKPQKGKRKIPESRSVAIDPETRKAFVAGEGVPDSETDHQPIDLMDGVEIQRSEDQIAPGQSLLSRATAREMAPTAPESIARQCDALCHNYQPTLGLCALLRTDFLFSGAGPPRERLEEALYRLELLSSQATQLRNSLATHYYV